MRLTPVNSMFGSIAFWKALAVWSLVGATGVILELWGMRHWLPGSKVSRMEASAIPFYVASGVAAHVVLAFVACILLWKRPVLHRSAMLLAGIKLGAGIPIVAIAVMWVLLLFMGSAYWAVGPSSVLSALSMFIGGTYMVLVYNLPLLVATGVLGGAMAGQIRSGEQFE